jgi:cysteine desulfurase/selenocysteine lyase
LGGHGRHFGSSGSAQTSLGFTTTPQEIDRFVEELIGAIGFLREHT